MNDDDFFNQIKNGLEDAIAFADGDKNQGRLKMNKIEAIKAMLDGEVVVRDLNSCKHRYHNGIIEFFCYTSNAWMTSSVFNTISSDDIFTVLKKPERYERVVRMREMRDSIVCDDDLQDLVTGKPMVIRYEGDKGAKQYRVIIEEIIEEEIPDIPF